MNQFLHNTKLLIAQHGESCDYVKVSPGVYDVSSGLVVNSEVTTTVKVYRKDLKATQYNYPSLIGKTNILVYLAVDTIVVSPTPNDKFTFGSETYTVDSVQEHRALNQLVLWRIACYKG